MQLMAAGETEVQLSAAVSNPYTHLRRRGSPSPIIEREQKTEQHLEMAGRHHTTTALVLTTGA